MLIITVVSDQTWFKKNKINSDIFNFKHFNVFITGILNTQVRLRIMLE